MPDNTFAESSNILNKVWSETYKPGGRNPALNGTEPVFLWDQILKEKIGSAFIGLWTRSRVILLVKEHPMISQQHVKLDKWGTWILPTLLWWIDRDFVTGERFPGIVELMACRENPGVKQGGWMSVLMRVKIFCTPTDRIIRSTRLLSVHQSSGLSFSEDVVDLNIEQRESSRTIYLYWHRKWKTPRGSHQRKRLRVKPSRY